MLDDLLQQDDPGENHGEVRVPTEPQRIFKQLHAVAVMISLVIIFILQYVFLNGYMALLLVSILLAGALEVPGNVLRLVESDPMARRLKVKFYFLFCGSLAFYCIIVFGLYFNRSCSCSGSA